jgi:acetyltransferase-like isoleucine patch superfamily enzyme
MSDVERFRPEGFGSLLAETRRTPWKAANELRRYASAPFVRAYFAWHGVQCQPGWHIYGRPVIQRYRPSRISIGRGLELRSWFSANPLGITRRCLLATWGAGAIIEIGEDVGMSGVAICAQTRVTIGNRVVIGANSVVTDTDFHSLDASHRFSTGTSLPISIEDDVFVGMHVLILKGVCIGRGAVIGAGSVVTRNVPAGAVVAGNPARIVRGPDE